MPNGDIIFMYYDAHRRPPLGKTQHKDPRQTWQSCVKVPDHASQQQHTRRHASGGDAPSTSSSQTRWYCTALSITRLPRSSQSCSSSSACSSQINVPRSSKSMASSQCFAPLMPAHPDMVTGCCEGSQMMFRVQARMLGAPMRVVVVCVGRAHLQQLAIARATLQYHRFFWGA